MDNLTPAQVVVWLRSQATKYSRLADQMESELGLAPASIVNEKPNGSRFVQHTRYTTTVSIPTPSRVREFMAGRKMRLQDIADGLGVQRELLQQVVNTENGFEVGDRGWIRDLRHDDEITREAVKSLLRASVDSD